jgi:hypothetical protein
METSHAGPSKMPALADTSPPSSSKVGGAAFVVALIALVVTLLAPSVGESSVREALARYDWENVYAILIPTWVIMIALDLVAIALGIIGARRPVGKVLSGAAIGIGATSLLGLLVHLIQTGLITFLFR